MKSFKPFLLAAVSGFTISTLAGPMLPAVGQTAPSPGAEQTSADEVTAATSAEEDIKPDAIAGDEAEPDTVEPNDVEADDDATDTDGEPDAAAEANTPAAANRLSETERIRRKLIIQADREYEAGNFAEAEALYRQAKDESWLLPRQFAMLPPVPFSDEALLSPAAAVYWREAQAGIANNRQSQAQVAFALLSAEYPAFIPGHLQYAAMLQSGDRPDEASAVLEQALTLYPDQTDLLLAQVNLLTAQEQWLEAAIASRQFVALNGDHPAAPAQATLAEENLKRFQRETRSEIQTGAIANLFTGILGYAFTGSIFGPFTAANSAILLLQGENAVGEQFSNRIQQQLPMLESPEALGYVRQIGNRLSRATGRNDLNYEFFVILDPNLNAFALPGGKVFVNAGAILDTHSEAELAGLLAHELSHSVLSHGFQIATRGNLSSSVAQYLPYGGLVNNVFLSGYSRQMERQADIVGTQILAASGYAADGLHNVMVTLNEQAEGGPRAPAWISTHPNPEDRVTYLKNLVERGGYNRYSYEGIASHEEIQAIVARELAAYEARQRADDSDSEPENAEPEAVEPEAVEPEEVQTDLYDAVERFDW
ncbi:M48 family metallopeptidase [Leptolyngbya sp. BC1307]|uniref:M48 family metallopeptidase n=1 Tax=Leptolyngbya sp. BC1307 TaxID=2029589 RepID=UPI000EFBC1BC|nr:M48 family metallopeptidase [Leptolyngbya sp. BC1307]